MMTDPNVIIDAIERRITETLNSLALGLRRTRQGLLASVRSTHTSRFPINVYLSFLRGDPATATDDLVIAVECKREETTLVITSDICDEGGSRILVDLEPTTLDLNSESDALLSTALQWCDSFDEFLVQNRARVEQVLDAL